LCSVTGAGKVTLIGSNCPASRVGRRVDCEGGRVDRQNDRPPAVRPPNNSYCLASSTHSSPAELPWTLDFNEHRPPADGRLAGRPRPLSRPTASIQAPAAATVLIGRTTVLQCRALLPACLRFLHTVKHFRIVSYGIVSCPLRLYRAVTSWHRHARRRLRGPFRC